MSKSNIIVTVVDAEHVAEGTVALQSALQFCDCAVCMLVLTKEKVAHPQEISVINTNEIIQDEVAELIYYKYSGDCLRWAIKPCLIEYALQEKDRVIYIDSDCYFVNNGNFLWEEVDPLLVTPHWREVTNKYLYLHGLYNAGVVGASRNGIEAIQWWKKACLWKTENTPEEGFFVDQKYLDIMPIEWGANICRHRGVNAAPWNKNREDLVLLHLSTREVMDDVLHEYYLEYREKVNNINGKITSTSNEVYMIARQGEDGIYGPVGGKVYSYEMAKRVLKKYKKIELGEFSIVPLDYHT
jgi:hypothetical protein